MEKERNQMKDELISFFGSGSVKTSITLTLFRRDIRWKFRKTGKNQMVRGRKKESDLLLWLQWSPSKPGWH